MEYTNGFRTPLSDIKQDDTSIIVEGPLALRSESVTIPMMVFPKGSRWSGNLALGYRDKTLSRYGFMFHVTSHLNISCVSLDARSSDGLTTPCRCRLTMGTKFDIVFEVMIDRSRVFGFEYKQAVQATLQPGTYTLTYELMDNNNLLQSRGTNPNAQRPVYAELHPLIKNCLGSLSGTSNLVEASRSSSSNIDGYSMQTLRTAPNLVAGYCGNLYMDFVSRPATLTCDTLKVSEIVCTGYTSIGGKFLMTTGKNVSQPASVVGPGLGSLTITSILPSDRYSVEATLVSTSPGGTVAQMTLAGTKVFDFALPQPGIAVNFNFEFQPASTGVMDIVSTVNIWSVTLSKLRVMKSF